MRNPSLTVGELKKKLKGVPDDTPVVRSSVDHSYAPIDVWHTTLILERANGYHMSEDHGDTNLQDPDNDVRLNAIVIE